MSAYDPARYGRAVGDDYDALYPGVPQETDATVALLGRLARERPEQSILELGIGTGRVALGLHHLGLRVAGIDGSESMVAQLRAKMDGDQLDVTIGDYRDAQVASRFSVVALLWNGIFDPRGRQAQLDIFSNAAHHLDIGGVFVVESFVLSDAQRSGDWSISPRYVGDEHIELQLARYDLATNTVERTLIHLRPEGPTFVTVKDTYAAPGELDMIAEVTGFDRMERWGGWSSEPYTATSGRHVTVYELRRRR